MALVFLAPFAQGLAGSFLAPQGRAPVVQGRAAVHTTAPSCRVGRSGSVSCVATEPALAAPEALKLDEASAALQKEQLLADGALAAARVREILEGVIDYSGSTRSGAAPSPLADFAPGATADAGTASAVAGAAPVPPAPAAAAPAPPPAPAKRKVAQAGATLGSPLVLGLSHKTATVEVREKLSIPEHRWNEASAALCE